MFSGVPGLLGRVHGDGVIVTEVREEGEEEVKGAEKLMSASPSGGGVSDLVLKRGCWMGMMRMGCDEFQMKLQ